MAVRNSPVDPRALQLGSAFTPAAPIRDTTLFSGRSELLIRIADAVNQPGMHCILFGERGVGKTSLANIAPQVLAERTDPGIAVARVNCDTADTYGSLMHKLMGRIVTEMERPRLGFSDAVERRNKSLVNFLPEHPSPDDVLTLLQDFPANRLLILDEFDRLTDENDTIALVADTIKALSDYAAPATFLLVGVADDVGTLIGAHPSIERCLTQIWMPRMTREELAGIVDNGLEPVKMRIDESVAWYIPAVSQGYPHYTHLLALHAARRSLKEGRDVVCQRDIEGAIAEALGMTERSIRDRYSAAVYSPSPSALYAPVLLACALAPADDLGFFNAQAVRAPLSAIMEREYNIPAFARHLDAFCKDNRGPALIKSGERRRYQYRFAVPLMRPFVLLQGIADGRIDAEVLR